MKRVIACICMLVMAMVMFCPLTVADSLEDQLLGTVSQQYESNGDPGAVSSGVGDLGGASYGAYQFAGNAKVPYTFAKWCVSSGENKTFGNRLLTAYEKDGNTFGQAFKTEWQAIAKQNKSEFYRLQKLYVKEKYYQPAVTALKTYLNLDISKYGIAFKNAVWSRTIQHGLGSYTTPSGFLGIMKQVDGTLANGVLSATEKQLITAIYQESGKVVTTGTNPMKAASAGGNAWIIEKYKLEGKYMKYYSGNSAAVQAGVYLRLQVNELNDLLEMLANYGGFGGSSDYGTTRPTMSGLTMSLHRCDVLRGWKADDGTVLAANKTVKKQGEASLSLQDKATAKKVGATLSFNGTVNLSGFTKLEFRVYLPKKQTTQSGMVTVTFYNQTKAMHTAQWNLTGLDMGWHTVTMALPTSVSTEQISRVGFKFANITGTNFLLDNILVKSDSPAKTMQFATVNADSLNCRDTADSAGNVLGQFADKTFLVLCGRAINGWYYCSGLDQNGMWMNGWCSGDYLNRTTFSVHSGDVDGNKTTGAADALAILQYVVKKITLTQTQKTASDVNYDGMVNAGDAQEVLKMVVNKQ